MGKLQSRMVLARVSFPDIRPLIKKNIYITTANEIPMMIAEY